MVKECFAPDCTHKPSIKGCTSHRFPSSPRQKLRWIKSLRRGDRLPNNFDIVCGCHFEKKAVTPSIYRRDPRNAGKFTPAKKRRSAKRLLAAEDTNMVLGETVARPSSTNDIDGEVLAVPLPPAGDDLQAYNHDVQVNLQDNYAFDAPMQPEEESVYQQLEEESVSQQPVEDSVSLRPEEESVPSIVVMGPSDSTMSDILVSHEKVKLETRKIIRRASNKLKHLEERVANLENERNVAVRLAYEREVLLENVLKEKDKLVQENSRITNVASIVSLELQELKKTHGDCRSVIQQITAANTSSKEEKTLLTIQMNEKNLQLEKCQKELAHANLKIQCLKEDVVRESARFMFAEFCKSDSKVSYYTGLPNQGTFYWLLSLFDNYTLTYYTGKNVKILTRENQLFMTLMLLKRGFKRGVLADWFQVSKQTVTNIVHSWISALHIVLFEGFLSEVSSLKKNQATLPECFRNFKDCRMILDCTEVRTAIPKTMKLHNLVFSHYKHYTTLKALVGIAPNGVPTFASKLYPGSNSDKAVVKDCGVVNVLKPGESVMADKGFLISDLLPKNVNLVRPPFLTTVQFTEEQVIKSKEISQARIHVERAIRRIKTFEILQFIPKIVVPIASQIFQVCVALTTLMPPLIQEVEASMSKEVSDEESD